MDKELVNEMIAYIEQAEEEQENEWGTGNMEKYKMPDLYYKLKALLESE